MFCIQMLSDPFLKEVWCETYDDIVCISEIQGTESIEFVQVKNEALDQLYTIAVFMARKDGKPSVYERSLMCDTCLEPVLFRIVTPLEVATELRALKLCRSDATRKHTASEFDTLKNAMALKPAASTCSPKGGGLEYWLDRALWEVRTERELEVSNKLHLLAYLETQSITIYTDTAGDIYRNLLWKVKSAAEADFRSNRSDKVLLRGALATWIQEQALPSPSGNNSRLRQKLALASQPDDTILNAVDMRRSYNMELRTPRYLTTDDSQFVSGKIRGILHLLQTKLDSGEIQEGRAFHNQCVREVISLKDQCAHLSRPPNEEFLLGCMYEITARCRHRFMRPQP